MPKANPATKVRIVGAGLAGCEAALILSARGVAVELIDIKPTNFTPAHSNPGFAELVCSNSLKGKSLTTSNGLLKQELKFLDSNLLEVAESVAIDAGGALAVDRDRFSDAVTKRISEHKNITVICSEYSDIDLSVPTIIATGPLTSERLCESLKKLIKTGNLFFYDAAAPIVETDSIDFEYAFYGSRYDKGGDDYINCPLDKEQYLGFVSELKAAGRVILKSFENSDVFEGCIPIEVMAERSEKSLRFGPLKPVGLFSKDGKKHYAVVQLRAENAEKTRYNLVGFQTNLKFGEQKRVFSMIPALKNAEFSRYGVMHRNTYINAAECLNQNLSIKDCPDIFIAGQLTGVEGYVESIAAGLLAAHNVFNYLSGLPPVTLDRKTMLGSIFSEVFTHRKSCQPVASNFGIVEPLEIVPRDKQQKYLEYSKRALEVLKAQSGQFRL